MLGYYLLEIIVQGNCLVDVSSGFILTKSRVDWDWHTSQWIHVHVSCLLFWSFVPGFLSCDLALMWSCRIGSLVSWSYWFFVEGL